ncbi:MAG TPA: YsnF/AvaK domain-containing protein [Polyangiales bacterium]|nr:YsnF/AvaK domain-containing protein [Polyangiales bacterium]
MDEWRPIVDADGRKGSFKVRDIDDSQAEVKLASGEVLVMPRAYASPQADGTFRFEHSFLRLLERSPSSEIVVPVIQEEVVIGKRAVERQHVQVRTTVSSREELVEVPLSKEELQVERVPIGRTVEVRQEPRQEGDTWIVPVYEEVLVVEKRLVLREEVRVTKLRRDEHESQRWTLRRQDVAIKELEGTK